MSNEEKVMDILSKIMVLNESKKELALAIDKAVSELCGISAMIGELSSKLKYMKDETDIAA